MKVYVSNVHGLDLQSDVTDRELIVILQAYDRGLVKGVKIAVVLDGRHRFLDVEAIDRARTLPSVVFSGYTMPPPPPLAEAQAAELRKRPHRGVFPFPPSSPRVRRWTGIWWRSARPRSPRKPRNSRGPWPRGGNDHGIRRLAAPEACEILAALPARVGRSALRIERTAGGWMAGYGKAKVAEGKDLPEVLIALAVGAFDGA